MGYSFASFCGYCFCDFSDLPLTVKLDFVKMFLTLKLLLQGIQIATECNQLVQLCKNQNMPRSIAKAIHHISLK